MEDNEPQFTPEESLHLIESMINKVKDRFNEDGHLYLFWGWLIFFSSIGEFILYNYVHYEKHYLVWSLTWVALVYQVFYLVKKHKKARVRTYTGHLIGYVWLAYVILCFLIGYLNGRIMGDRYFYHIFPTVLALYGMPLFLTGVIIRFKPLVLGAFSCWLLSIAAAFLPYEYQMLCLSVAMIFGWIIPGYMLRAKYKRQLN